MNLNDEVTYCLIFDTNALFQAYERKADFTAFSFNAKSNDYLKKSPVYGHFRKTAA